MLLLKDPEAILPQSGSGTSRAAGTKPQEVGRRGLRASTTYTRTGLDTPRAMVRGAPHTGCTGRLPPGDSVTWQVPLQRTEASGPTCKIPKVLSWKTVPCLKNKRHTSHVLKDTRTPAFRAGIRRSALDAASSLGCESSSLSLKEEEGGERSAEGREGNCLEIIGLLPFPSPRPAELTGRF